jgi:glutathione S-transferase
MITLCGFAISNYYNKVKMALLEKNIPFTEELVMTRSKEESVLSASPLAKVPFIRTAQGNLCESQAINDYLEAAYPTPALMPSDAFDAAKERELITFIELHLELVARELYPEAFFGGKVSDEVKASVRAKLVKNIDAFKRLAQFAPYVGGEQFTLADCAAYVSLPLVGSASKIALGEDLLGAAGVDYKPYLKLIGERPSAQRVNEDKKAAVAAMAKPK